MNGGEKLALLNACLNGSAAICISAALFAVKTKRITLHQKLMWTAFGISCAFLVSYLTRRAVFGDKPYEGEGLLRPIYFSILISHVILAIVVVPLVLRTLYIGNATRKDKARVPSHRKIAKWTFPIWMYVSVTGVIVYLMLY